MVDPSVESPVSAQPSEPVLIEASTPEHISYTVKEWDVLWNILKRTYGLKNAEISKFIPVIINMQENWAFKDKLLKYNWDRIDINDVIVLPPNKDVLETLLYDQAA
jgi:nucleoid-associated protein YgaU